MAKNAKNEKSAGSTSDMVEMELHSTYGYTDPITKQQKFYGPGKTQVPERLARVLGHGSPRRATKGGRRAGKAAKTDTAKSTKAGRAAGASDAGAKAADTAGSDAGTADTANSDAGRGVKGSSD